MRCKLSLISVVISIDSVWQLYQLEVMNQDSFQWPRSSLYSVEHSSKSLSANQLLSCLRNIVERLLPFLFYIDAFSQP